MLKSTYKIVNPPLPLDWTEHKAPTGHLYYFNSVTKQSTYTRPLPPEQFQGNLPLKSHTGNFLEQVSVLDVKNSESSYRIYPYKTRIDSQGGEWRESKCPRVQKPQPIDKPKFCQPIPGFEDWRLVHTKYDRRFVYNVKKNQSFWRIPEKLKSGILALDQLRIKEKAKVLDSLNQNFINQEAQKLSCKSTKLLSKFAATGNEISQTPENEGMDFTDDGSDEEFETSSQQAQNSNPEKPTELTEEDIGYQLTMMGEDYCLEQEDYEEEFYNRNINDSCDQDSITLFKDLLDEFNVNPYSPWDKIVDDGKLVDDIRYTALPNMKTRKKVWDEWSCEKIKYLRKMRENEEKKTPKLRFLEFLQEHATPKLYWPEFKRKYRKFTEIRDPSMTEREREKIYRDHINCLKLIQST